MVFLNSVFPAKLPTIQKLAHYPPPSPSLFCLYLFPQDLEVWKVKVMGWDKNNWLKILIRKIPAAILMTESIRQQTLAPPGNPQQQTTRPQRFPHCSLHLRIGITQPLLTPWNWCHSYSPAGTSSPQKRHFSCHLWKWHELLKSNSWSWTYPPPDYCKN